MKRISSIIMLSFLLLMSGASSAYSQEAKAPPKPPANLQSSAQLTEDAGKHDSWTYRNPQADFRKYKRFIVQDTRISSDPTATWGKTTAEMRQKFASYLTNALRTEMKQHYQLANAPGPDVAVLRLTLLGVEGTKGGMATASRMTPLGLGIHSVKSLAGKKGSFTGSVQAAFEMIDSRSNDLQFAAVRRRSPNALDIGAATSTENTVKAVADDIAEAIRKGLDKANGRQT